MGKYSVRDKEISMLKWVQKYILIRNTSDYRKN